MVEKSKSQLYGQNRFKFETELKDVPENKMSVKFKDGAALKFQLLVESSLVVTNEHDGILK